MYPFTQSTSCLRRACGPRNRCTHLQPAGGAGVRPNIRLPHHLQSSLRRRRSRHEGGQRVRGETRQLLLNTLTPVTDVISASSCIVNVDQKRENKLNLTALRQVKVFIFINFLFALNQGEISQKLQPGHLSLRPPITLFVLMCVCSEITSVTLIDFCVVKA